MEGGISNYHLLTILTISLATVYRPFAAVTGGTRTYNRRGLLIDITCESDIKGKAVGGRQPSFHDAGWRGGFQTTTYSRFSPFHWRLSTVLQVVYVTPG